MFSKLQSLFFILTNAKAHKKSETRLSRATNRLGHKQKDSRDETEGNTTKIISFSLIFEPLFVITKSIIHRTEKDGITYAQNSG